MFEKQMNLIEDLFVKHVQVTQDFWNLECDLLYDFKYYFYGYNPKNLVQTRLSGPRKKNQNSFIALAERLAGLRTG